MARDGKVSLGRKQITMQLGQLFVDRASINLHSDILDNPDYFWEDDEWLPAYARVAKYLEITRRAEVLNKRLDIIKELFDMLANELHNAHSNKLEWIIIVLIILEVFFQVVQLIMETPWKHPGGGGGEDVEMLEEGAGSGRRSLIGMALGHALGWNGEM